MAKKFTKVVGLVEAQNNINRMLKTMEGKTPLGLVEAARFVRKDMSRHQPYIPRDSGALEESWFARPFNLVKTHPVVEAGFDKPYAVYVHENMNTKVKWTRQGSGPKFLELALKRNTEEISKVVAKYISVPI